jgi:glycosyltransferase involved in cell wall biosynthesis
VKFSIITVCFNAVETIQDTIDSLAAQHYDDVEYIVVDGGSTDGTLEIITQSPNITRFVSEPDQGIYDAMNKGIAVAQGDVIGILNADEFYSNSDALNVVADAFIINPHVDMIISNVDFVASGELAKSVRFYSSMNFSPWKMRFGLMPAHPGLFVKKSAYQQAGKYKLGYKIGADFDMLVRLILVHKLPYGKLNKTLVRMRIGGVSTSGIQSYILSTQEIVKSLNENKIYTNMFMVLARLPVKFIQKLIFNIKMLRHK